MKKIYQTVIDKGTGNCMQAAVASLFELPLNDVPNFILLKENWGNVFRGFFKKHNNECEYFYFPEWDMEEKKKALKYDGGVKGFFFGVVDSQTFKDVTHAVIVDEELNIVHDPNPNQKALELKPEDVKYVITNRKGWSSNYKEKKFIIDQP